MKWVCVKCEAPATHFVRHELVLLSEVNDTFDRYQLGPLILGCDKHPVHNEAVALLAADRRRCRYRNFPPGAAQDTRCVRERGHKGKHHWETPDGRLVVLP